MSRYPWSDGPEHHGPAQNVNAGGAADRAEVLRGRLETFINPHVERPFMDNMARQQNPFGWPDPHVHNFHREDDTVSMAGQSDRSSDTVRSHRTSRSGMSYQTSSSRPFPSTRVTSPSQRPTYGGDGGSEAGPPSLSNSQSAESSISSGDYRNHRNSTHVYILGEQPHPNEDELTGALVPPVRRWLCEFDYLPCRRTFDDLGSWLIHGMTHFYSNAQGGPRFPLRHTCLFINCNFCFEGPAEDETAWISRCTHIWNEHLRDRDIDRSLVARSDLIVHHYRIGVLSPERYRELYELMHPQTAASAYGHTNRPTREERRRRTHGPVQE